MPADRLRVLVPALLAIAMIVGSSLLLDWFVVEGGDAIDLREAHSTAASTTFWVAVLFAIVVVMQVGARVFADQVSHRFTRAGYLIGATLFGNAFIAGYLLGPDLDVFDIEVARTWAPAMMLGGALAGMVALYYAALEESFSAAIIEPVKPDLAPARALPRKVEAKPDAVAKPAPPRLPSSSDETRESQPAPVVAAEAPAQRRRAPTHAELVAEMSGVKLRAASSAEGSDIRESQRMPVSDDAGRDSQRARTSTSSGVRNSQRGRAPTNADIAAEMSGTKLRAASSSEGSDIRESQRIPAPAIGRTATTDKPALARTVTPDKPAVGRTVTPDKPAVGRTVTPDKPAVGRTVTPDRTARPHRLRGKLRYAALTAQLTRGGVDARREDGSAVLVVWRDVVGAVARRLPPELDGETFVDLVSTAGSTLRIVPWTRLEGDAITSDDRPLALLRYIVAKCPDITLDPATREFIEGRAEAAAQLPDATTLAAHDERLA